MQMDSNSSKRAASAAGLLLCALLATPASGSERLLGTSFFDPFDSFDEARWLKSDGWTNGEHQGCWWSASRASIAEGMLELTMSPGLDGDPDLCAEIQSQRRYGYGLYEARMRGTSGSGLVSAFFTYIGPPLGVRHHDEIDFELLGSDSTQMQLNFYTSGKGENEFFADLGFDAGEAFADYAFDWRPDGITWFVNGRKVHETSAGDRLPRNPGTIFFSLWSGTSVVDDWLGPFTFPDATPRVTVDWVAFTAPGDKCQFPASIACQ
jgi:endo-1,3-1,4-beta-glycanase ExoK